MVWVVFFFTWRTKVPDTMIRNVPAEQHQRIQDIARQRDVTQNEIYLEAIAAYCVANDPQVCIGWLEIDRSGNIDSREDCPEDRSFRVHVHLPS